ncbi:MAG: hypothetical protein K0S39_3617 [Paenibacillus sp.]|jgi:hypothetical protein|nr:hypothetical protein [Paenibacillus sp.]
MDPFEGSIPLLKFEPHVTFSLYHVSRDRIHLKFGPGCLSYLMLAAADHGFDTLVRIGQNPAS